jgi:thioredoxin reductase (NADPH)
MPTNGTDVHDITIVGGGPAGLFAAYYAGFRSLRVKIVDSLHELGGQLKALYPEKFIYDSPGFPVITAKQLVRQLAKQMEQYQPTLALGEMAQELTRVDDKVFRLRTDKGDHLTRAVLIAGGIGVFSPKKFDKPELDAWGGKGVDYLMHDLHDYTAKRVLIVGGGDSAVDWAVHLHRIADHVTLVHRRDQFRAHEGMVRKACEAVTVKTFYEVKELHGGDQLEAATIFDNRTRVEERIEVDMVLCCLGFRSNPGPIKSWGVELENDGVKVNAASMESSLPGVFACGDIAQYRNKLKLIVVAFGEAAIAINHIAVYLDPKKKISPGHSSG